MEYGAYAALPGFQGNPEIPTRQVLGAASAENTRDNVSKTTSLKKKKKKLKCPLLYSKTCSS